MRIRSTKTQCALFAERKTVHVTETCRCRLYALVVMRLYVVVKRTTKLMSHFPARQCQSILI